jgi:predicted HTH transcriptional regulator
MPLRPGHDEAELEIAKDVSALANALGGIIVLGFDTTRDPLTSGEHISDVRPFPISMVDPDRYRKIVHEYVYPPLAIVVRVFMGEDGKGVAAILVEGALNKPYIVSKMIDDAGQNIGAHFGYFERKQDVVPAVSAPRIQQQLAAGQQWTSIEQRLQAIEANIGSWGKSGPTVKNVGITERYARTG